MKTIITYAQYNEAIKLVEKLLDKIDEATPKSSPQMIELLKACDIIEKYESAHYPLPKPNIVDRTRFYFEHRFNFNKLLPWKKMKL